MRRTLGDIGLRMSQQLLLVYAFWRCEAYVLYQSYLMFDSLSPDYKNGLLREFERSFTLLPLPCGGSVLVWLAIFLADVVMIAVMASMGIMIGALAVCFVTVPVHAARDLTISWSDLERWSGKRAKIREAQGE